MDNRRTELSVNDATAILSYSDEETSIITEKELDYEELPNALEECKFLKDTVFNTADFIAGKELSRQNFEGLLDKSLIHISTHSISNSNSKYETSILIRDEEGLPIHYFGYELLNHNMPSFVFLNACETGIGYIQIGEGVYSFSRYCKMAGAETVISTLWNVKDEEAAMFSNSYYKNWLKGKSALEAFTDAQMYLKSVNSDPYVWAAFRLEGNPNVYISNN